MGILSDNLVKETQRYLDAEKEIKNNELVKEILLVFPNSHLYTYRRKDNK